MEGRINQVWWIRYGQKYLKCFLASIVFLCVVGVLLVLITYGIKTGKQPGKNQTPPPNLHMPPPNTNQPISRFATNVIMSTTVPPWIPSTTIVTLVDRQTPTQLLPTKFQPQTQFPPQISDKMTTGYAVVISLAVVGGLAAFCLIALYVRNKSENATCLLRLSCCRNTYRPHGNDNFPTDDLDLDDDEEDVF
ncbi:hypothetical protein HOLleu_17865 [Holothuria leucospilota]|uniref:Uncharacterized protein n=1 Tax=Holothuria leucospilota TaxID=206669 RepID=A0A9Q1H8M6_HOLLE|nr:hypothetical protein HOLleu_17865 [Holothuria leucospilota]